VYATEDDEDALTFIRQNIDDVNLFQGEFSEANYPNDFFDYILVYHVIEHVLDPTAMVKELQRIIKPGGVLFIGTPNIGSMGYMLYRQINFLKGNIPGMEHTFLFTKRRLASLLQENGFRIQVQKAEAHTEAFTTIIKSKDSFNRKVSRIVQLIFKVNQRVVCVKC
jgi:2-polyprenyl-3-methyl-5-hydroxy-6-metoxy-1,4-benzoquinol methylase